jgi:hypothetical protein
MSRIDIIILHTFYLADIAYKVMLPVIMTPLGVACRLGFWG